MQTEQQDPRITRLNFRCSTVIGRYRLSTDLSDTDDVVSPLGLGGSSVVFTAFQELNSERRIFVPRALKLFLMREDLNPADADTSFVPADSNFLEEIITVSQLSHENLVQVTDAGEFAFEDSAGVARRLPYIVSHLVRGCTLRDIMEEKPRAGFAIEKIKADPTVAVAILSQIARGLDYLHDQSVLHCDIAPKNIFVEDGAQLRAIVGDVGLSRKIDPNGTSRVFVAGTKSYSPPEISLYFGKQVEGTLLAQWFPYWDLFAYSKTAMELLSKVSAWTGQPWVQAAAAKATSCHADVQTQNSAGKFAQLIEYCLPVHRQRAGVPELEPSPMHSRKRMMPIAPLSLTARVDSLVRHPALTRLQSVPQLTIVRSASPGGNHTRYEHSLGVMENVRRMLSTLIDEPSFLGILGRDSIETGLVAALLYNAHRFPFSNIVHELNKRLPPGGPKVFPAFARSSLLSEVFGEAFRSHKGQTLTEQITKSFPSVDHAKLNRILTSSGASHLVQPDEVALYTLLNSSLDARVIDFVRRDSLHLGLSSGDAFELEDLLPHLAISPVRTGSAINQVTLRPSGISVAEQIILMRYWLYQRVYWNQPNRAYNAAVRRALLDLSESPSFESKFRTLALQVDEGQLLAFLHTSAVEAGMASTVALLASIKGTEKTLYREVFSRSRRQCDSDPVLQDADDLSTLISKTMSYKTMLGYERTLNAALSGSLGALARNPAPLVLLDVPFEPGNVKLGADIFVATQITDGTESGGLQSLEKVSPIISAVNSNFANELQRLRILVRRDIPRDETLGPHLYAALRRLVQD